jgi:hypothetical protein
VGSSRGEYENIKLYKFLPMFFLFASITSAQSTTTNPFDMPDFPQMPDFGNINDFNLPPLPYFVNATNTNNSFPNLPNSPDLPGFNNSTTSTTTAVGVLKVDSIETVSNNAVADNTFQNGLRYVFNITVPTDEPAFAMRFQDWANTSSPGSIPVANNIQISTAQASSTSPVLLTGANVYSTPMMIVGDLDTNMPGRQIKVLVKTKIPTGTPNGNYTTNYGVRTQ